MRKEINKELIDSYKNHNEVIEAVTTIHDRLMAKYDQLLIDNDLNPDFYEPEISFGSFENNKMIVSAIPCQIINGVKVKIRTTS